jgi:LPXTG-motif cell wall-anchored protein
VAAYVIAGLVLLALVAYLLVRSRSRARRDV